MGTSSAGADTGATEREAAGGLSEATVHVCLHLVSIAVGVFFFSLSRLLLQLCVHWEQFFTEKSEFALS